MLVEKHDLVHELPEYKDRIHELKTSNRHFANLFVAIKNRLEATFYCLEGPGT